MRKRPAPPSKRSRYLGAIFGAITIFAVAAVIALNLEHFHLNHGGGVVSGEHWSGTETFCLMGQDVGLGVVTADDCGSPITDFTLTRYSNGSLQTDGGRGILGLNGQILGGQFSGTYKTEDGTEFTVTGTFYSNGSADIHKVPVMPEGGGGVNITWHLYRE